MHMQQRNAPQQANVNVQQQQHQQPTVAYQQPQGMAGMHQQGLAFGAGGFGGFGAGAFGGAFGAPHSFMGFGGGGVMDGVSMGGGLGGNGLVSRPNLLSVYPQAHVAFRLRTLPQSSPALLLAAGASQPMLIHPMPLYQSISPSSTHTAIDTRGCGFHFGCNSTPMEHPTQGGTYSSLSATASWFLAQGGGGGMGGMGEQPTYMAMGGVVGEPGFGGVVSGNFHSEAPAGMQAVSVGGQGRQQMQQPAPHMQQQQQQAQHAPQQQQHHGGGAPRRRPMGNGPALGVTRGLTVKMRGLPFRVQVRAASPPRVL
jgi:hypothetical protein